jgi:hypothetical protein
MREADWSFGALLPTIPDPGKNLAHPARDPDRGAHVWTACNLLVLADRLLRIQLSRATSAEYNGVKSRLLSLQ